ncbi:VOC family protein [Geomicrobium sediminis]|uniref:Lactoylglutathione lyase n=1 Tax=Geomicrobium sediminis TaxID=1347788 RepID=A0ABS2PAG8_9BACL|nr:VOC family protein [Geomicrobium sediminis]MBM7632404.1 putative lactoylglutathione lyase [Geomicrobium sediminis]
MKPRITIITLAVDDLEKSTAFYQNGLGFSAEGLVQGSDQVVFELENGITLVLNLRTELEEIDQRSADSERSSEVILSSIADRKEEVDETLRRVSEFGGTILPRQPKDYEWGYSGHFKDLDGHIWEIVYFY